jgi:transposase
MTDDGQLRPGERIHLSEMDRLWQYLAQFGDEPKRVVFEATANARWLQRQLAADATVAPVAVTPHKVRIIAETVAKTDKIDATVLASLSKMNALPRAWLPDDEVETLRDITRHRSSLVANRTRAKNHVNGLLVRWGWQRPYGDIFGTLGRAWLAELPLSKPQRLQLDQWLDDIDQRNKQLRPVESYLYRTLAKEARWAEDLALLTTMPGWGKLTALTILAELGDYRRFRSRSAVSAFAGIVPSSKRSDQSCRYGKITKRGPTAMRRILIEVALHGVRRVPRYQALHARVMHKKGAKVAKVAVARQMLEDGWTMLMKREPFRSMAPVQAASLARVG